MATERRKFSRIDHAYAISFKRHNSREGNWDISNSRNLSLGGALFLSTEFFLPDNLLDIRLKVSGKSDYCRCRGIVKRCRGPFKNSFYETAVYFTHIDKDSIGPLRKSVDFFLKRAFYEKDSFNNRSGN